MGYGDTIFVGGGIHSDSDIIKEAEAVSIGGARSVGIITRMNVDLNTIEWSHFYFANGGGKNEI